MQGTFNADEVFQMAIEIEKRGAAFYRAASDFVDEPGVKALLKSLSEMELEHEKEFASLQESMTRDSSYAQGYDPDGVAASYLGSLTSGKVFDPSLIFAGTETVEGVLKKGIEAEKNSIVLYTGLKGVVPDELGRDKVDRIIREEMKHLAVLVEQLGSLEG